jgi:hypothetical protein
VIFALLINYAFFTKAAARRDAKAQVQREAAEAESAKVAEERRIHEAETSSNKMIENTAAEHVHFLARYINSGFTRNPGLASIAVAIENEQGPVNQKIAIALTQRLKTDGIQLFNSFFKPEFVADKFVARLLSGETGIIEQLELTNSLDAVLIGRQTVAYSTNAELGNTITANLNLELTTLPVGMTRESQSWHYSSNGIGVRPQEARQLAEDRIIEQIGKDTNMVLAPHF